MVSRTLQSKPGPDQVTETLARLQSDIELRNRELAEARQQHAAMAEVLKAISRSNFDMQAVLNTVVESAARLCGASLGQLYRWDGT
ncbi:MAG TPA: hypothetical protein VL101_08365, partial [Nordella sp.]|nr:hypothetical protein [Nordella sp.]